MKSPENRFLVCIFSCRDTRTSFFSRRHPGDANLGWSYYITTREPGPFLECEGEIVSGVHRPTAESAGWRFRDLTRAELLIMPERLGMADVQAGNMVTWGISLPRDAGWQGEQRAKWITQHGPGPYRVLRASPFKHGMPMVHLEGWAHDIVASWLKRVEQTA